MLKPRLAVGDDVVMTSRLPVIYSPVTNSVRGSIVSIFSGFIHFQRRGTRDNAVFPIDLNDVVVEFSSRVT